MQKLVKKLNLLPEPCSPGIVQLCDDTAVAAHGYCGAPAIPTVICPDSASLRQHLQAHWAA